jgi:hypothetical protein
MTDLELSHLPVTDPRYKPLDVTQYKFYETHDPIKYANKIYSKIPLSESSPVPYDVKEKPGYYYTKTISKISPQYKDAILQEGINNYINDEGLRKEVNYVFDTNKDEVKRLEKKYNTKIPDAQSLAGIYTWDLQPVKENTTDIRPSEELKNKNILSRQKPSMTQMTQEGNLFDTLSDITFKSGAKIKDGVAIDKNNNALNGTVYLEKINIPTEILDAIGVKSNDKVKGFDVTFVNGIPEKFVNKITGTLTRQAMANKQLKMNTEPAKGRQPSYGPKVAKETLADRMRKLKTQK